MNKTALASLCVICLTLCGCMSAVVVSSGKRYEHLAKPSTSVTKVRKSLGNPLWRESYFPPIPINKTGVFLAYTVTNAPFEPFVWDGMDVGETKTNVAVLCEIYTRQGPYADMERGQAYGMIGAMTLGVGDVLCLPFAIYQRHQMGKRYYSLTFWYNEKGTFVGLYEGDIRDCDRFAWDDGRKTMELNQAVANDKE